MKCNMAAIARYASEGIKPLNLWPKPAHDLANPPVCRASARISRRHCFVAAGG
jgi:hypothetical protein